MNKKNNRLKKLTFVPIEPIEPEARQIITKTILILANPSVCTSRALKGGKNFSNSIRR